MKNIKNVRLFKESLSYCDSCHMLSDTRMCNFCQILDILGITKEEDADNIYGKLKYYKNFKDKNYAIDFIDTLKISDEQKEKIIELL
jgi:recombinational DNA repair protein RecR